MNPECGCEAGACARAPPCPRLPSLGLRYPVSAERWKGSRLRSRPGLAGPRPAPLRAHQGPRPRPLLGRPLRGPPGRSRGRCATGLQVGPAPPHPPWRPSSRSAPACPRGARPTGTGLSFSCRGGGGPVSTEVNGAGGGRGERCPGAGPRAEAGPRAGVAPTPTAIWPRGRHGRGTRGCTAAASQQGGCRPGVPPPPGFRASEAGEGRGRAHESGRGPGGDGEGPARRPLFPPPAPPRPQIHRPAR